MVIKKINWKKNNIELIFENSELFLNNSVYDEHYLYVGKDLSEEEVNQLKEESDLSRHNAYLSRLISLKEYSKKELIDKLVHVKHLKVSQAEIIISGLENKKLIDDKKYTLEFIEDCHRKGYGEKWIIRHLKDKGLDAMLYQTDEEKEREKALNWIEPLYNKYKGSSYRQCSTKIFENLLRLGFTSDVIYYAIESKLDRTEYSEESYLETEMEKIIMKLDFENKISVGKIVMDKLTRKGYSYDDVKKMLGEKYGIVC